MASTLQRRSCPVCGQTEAELYLKKGELVLARCRGCSMVYVNPVPQEFASGQYYDQTAAGYYLSPDKLSSDYAAARFERELRLFRKHCAGGTVLDVGCSSGAFLHQLQQRFPGCYESWGTDMSGPALDYAESKGAKVIRGDFLDHDFGQQQFDAVTFWAVLEHLAEPRLFLEKAATLLKSSGLCFVLVPNMKSLAVRLLGGRYRYIYAQHLNYFTEETVRRLAQKSFEVIEFRSTHFNPLVIWQDWRSGGREVCNVERAELLRRTTSYKENPLLKPAKMIYGLAERALGGLGLADNLVAILKKR
jgi:2-polyprenyl-3-methyl-5-hydroxy-6-metoxy-1,4-benzoquinol methylase